MSRAQRSGLIAMGVIAALGAGVAWLARTENGARWTLARATALTHGRLTVHEIRGTLMSPLTVQRLRWYDRDAGVDVSVGQATLEWRWNGILRPSIRIASLLANEVDVNLFAHPPTPDTPIPSLRAPIDIAIDRLAINHGRLRQQGRVILAINSAELKGQWRRTGIALEKLDVDSPDGHVRISGTLGQELRADAHASGEFRWRVGQEFYAGRIDVLSRQQKLETHLRLAAPFAANLRASIGETDSMPWTVDFAMPAFDPRGTLLSGSSIENLGAEFRGQGNGAAGEIRGRAVINGQSLYVEPLSARVAANKVLIDRLTLRDPSRRGSLNVTGEVQLPDSDARSPLAAKLQLRWTDLALPKEWVGQPLVTHGDVSFDGSMSTFQANGNLAIGPPGRLADVAIDIAGTPKEINIRRALIDEHSGTMSVSGRVQLDPAIVWNLQADAHRFDPGKLLAGWNGALGFHLDTRGEMTKDGPSAVLKLTNLAGNLRGRVLAGHADLTLSPRKVIAGSALLRSGKSTLEFSGAQGQRINADFKFDIASLDDWIPQSTGSAHGAFHVSGNWPALALQGSAEAKGIAAGDASLKQLKIDAAVENPRAPAGSLKVAAHDISASGFLFTDVQIELSGNERAHTFTLAATGQPVSIQLKASGARQGTQGWNGTIDALALTVTGIEPLVLRQSAALDWSPRRFDLGQTCLAGARISACVQASKSESGELRASYALEHLPLGIVAALAAPGFPLAIEAIIEGRGDIRRTPDGAFFGETHVTSSEGKISEAGGPAEENAADALLAYENFKLDALLSGDTGSAALNAAVNREGSIEGHAEFSNLRGASPSIDGTVKAILPDLSPAGLFVPQLTSVHGKGEAVMQLSGAVVAPQMTGSISLHDLSADVPQVGIALRGGELKASMSGPNDITLNGKVASGNGNISLEGHSDSSGNFKVKALGKDFQAANIPGAKIIIDPDLDFVRTADRMTLTGSLAIPSADIDIAKLPRQGKAQNASADVVVIDDENPAVQAAKKVPLFVDVAVSLGSKVSLVGYGLDSKVNGLLKVREAENQDTTASGELNVSGKYKAYGQDLTIERGKILYGGQRIDDPQVNLIATRTIENIVAKLSVTGSAKKPILGVSSDPPLPQSQALSYLVTGKPMAEVGSGEGDLVQSAARSLGGAAGNLLAGSIGKRLGVSQLGVEDTPEAGGSAFTVGQYLSPRLYLSYGVGLFEPGQVVTLRYRISKRFSLEAVQGSLSQRAGLNYRVER